MAAAPAGGPIGLPGWMVMPALAALFLAAYAMNIGYLSMDDVDLIVRERPTDRFVYYCLLDARYLLVIGLRAFQWVGLDVLHDHTVFAVLYALAFARFCQAAVGFLTSQAALPAERVRLLTLMFGALLLTHGYFGDLVAWKNVFPFMVMMLVPVALCLETLSRSRLTPLHWLLVFALLLLTNLVYQPGTSAVLFLSFGWALVSALSPGGGRRLRPMALRVAAVTALYALAGIGYVAITRIVSALTGIVSERPFQLATPRGFLLNLRPHAEAVVGIFDVTESIAPYGANAGPHSGGPITLAALGLVLALAVLAWRRGAAAPAWLALAGLVALLTNPQNLMLATYWPSYRSSFYAGGFLPVLLIAAVAAGPSRRMMGRLAVLAGLILAVQATMFLRLSGERTEVQRRDITYAQRIVDTLEADPTTRGLTSIRMPCEVPHDFYRGILENSGDTNRSVFASCWALESLLFYASGRRYTRLGDPNCPGGRPTGQTILVRRDGDVAQICF